MNDRNRKILLIVVAAVALLALVWFFALRGDSQEAASPDQPEVSQTPEEANPETPEEPAATTEPPEPTTGLGMEARAILDSYQDILQVQEQYSDSCPSEETFVAVGEQFGQAYAAQEALAANLIASTDIVAIEEAQSYQPELGTLLETLGTLGPEIIERCGLDPGPVGLSTDPTE